MTVEVITNGGGQYIVNVLNAVAAWCGGGGFRSMLQVVMVMGLGYVLLTMAFSLDWKGLFNWFLQATFIYMAMIVPTTTVVVVDTINPQVGNGSVGNVPLGLALTANLSSTLNNWLTTTAESVFTLPATLRYSQSGMLYPTQLNDMTRMFQITDPVMETNLSNFIQQCTFYDVMLGQGVTFASLAASPDLLTAMGPGSAARGTTWISTGGTGSSVVPCNTAYSSIQAAFPNLATAGFNADAPAFYPNVPAATAVQKLQNDLPVMAQYFYGGTGQSAQTLFQQRALTNAFMEARANFGNGGGDTFAQLHATVQAENTMQATAQQAMTWVPVLNLVLTIVFYAMFPVVFPLFLFPQTGVATMKGYLMGFFYLASWGPIYAVLNMFVTARAASQLTALAPNGLTMGTMAGVDAINHNAETLAGSLLIFVPVLAAGMAKGAMSISGNATSMLAPVMHGAEAAATERTTGNYSYGNEHFQNITGNQVNTMPMWNVASSAIPQVNVREGNGAMTSHMPDGSVRYDTSNAISKLPFDATLTSGETANLQKTGADYINQGQSLRETASQRWSQGVRQLESLSSGSRTASGTEGSTGTQAANTATQTDRSGTEAGGGITTNRAIGDTTSLGKSHADAGQWDVGGRANVSGGAAAGPDTFLGKAQVKGGVDGSVGYRRSWTRTDNANHSNSDALTNSQNSNIRHYHANGQDITLSDGGYTKDGTFHRVEGFSEKRHAIEKDFSEAQSFEQQAARFQDKGQRYEDIASYSQSHGFQVSENMSQVIASRYAQVASSPAFRDLGAPSITNVNPTAHQQQVRAMIVNQIVADYAESGLVGARGQMESTRAALGASAPLATPASYAPPQSPFGSHPGAGGHHSGPSGASSPTLGPQTPHGAPGDDKARAAIALGAGQLQAQEKAAEAAFGKTVEEQKPRDKQANDDTNW